MTTVENATRNVDNQFRTRLKSTTMKKSWAMTTDIRNIKSASGGRKVVAQVM